MSFLVNINGVGKPYSPGVIREARMAERISRLNPIKPVTGQHPEQFKRVQNQYEHPARNRETERVPILVARDIMSAPVVTGFIKDTVLKLQTHFQTHRFRHIPILNTSRDIVGIISDRDLLGHLEPDKDLVSTCMHTPVLTAHSDTIVREIAKVLIEERIGCVPIVDDNVLVGIVTRSDILRAIVNGAPLEMWA